MKKQSEVYFVDCGEEQKEKDDQIASLKNELAASSDQVSNLKTLLAKAKAVMAKHVLIRDGL